MKCDVFLSKKKKKIINFVSFIFYILCWLKNKMPANWKFVLGGASFECCFSCVCVCFKKIRPEICIKT